MPPACHRPSSSILGAFEGLHSCWHALDKLLPHCLPNVGRGISIKMLQVTLGWEMFGKKSAILHLIVVSFGHDLAAV